MTITYRDELSRDLTPAEVDANFRHVLDSSNSTFTQSGSGATLTVQEKLRQSKSVLDFVTDATIRGNIVAGTNVADVTSYVQAALDSDFNLDFQGYTYHCNNLTDDKNDRVLSSSVGAARIIKNANGALLTISGDRFIAENIALRGDASSPTFTGDNWVSTGDHFTLINCGSRWTSGRAVKSTGGGRTVIYGTCDIYATSDATASGYDIEIGVSGTATLYHHLQDIYTSQSTGGILLVDTGSHTIVGGQFGKLTIDSGTGPAGSNGGKTIGSRITGAVTVELPGASLTNCEFGADADITLAASTSGCVLVGNAYASGCTITNNGNANNLIIREVSAGSTSQLKLGADNSLSIITTDTTQGSFSFPRLKIEVVATASLPNANAAHDGRVIIEDAGAGNRNLIIYAGGERFRIDGGAAF